MQHIERVTIYGIFENGICLYVGQTVNEWQRRDKHRKRWPNGEFRVLRRTRQPNANKLEKQWIRHYQRKGQAQFNKGARGSNHTFKASPARTVIVEGFDNSFPSAASAARALRLASPLDGLSSALRTRTDLLLLRFLYSLNCPVDGLTRFACRKRNLKPG